MIQKLLVYSYYPLYPPSADTPIDLSLAPEALEIPSVPDVLILPSDLAPFVKVIITTISIHCYFKVMITDALSSEIIWPKLEELLSLLPHHVNFPWSDDDVSYSKMQVLSLEKGNDGDLVRCLCMNPGRLAKGIGGGTFVELKYHDNLDNSRASIIRI